MGCGRLTRHLPGCYGVVVTGPLHCPLQSINSRVVNKVLVAMETLFRSNRGTVWVLTCCTSSPKHLVCMTCCFICGFILFFFFCIYIFLFLKRTVCGCIFRLLVPFKTPVHTHKSRPSPPKKHTNTVTELSTRGFWQGGHQQIFLFLTQTPPRPPTNTPHVMVCVPRSIAECVRWRPRNHRVLRPPQ